MRLETTQDGINSSLLRNLVFGTRPHPQYIGHLQWNLSVYSRYQDTQLFVLHREVNLLHSEVVHDYTVYAGGRAGHALISRGVTTASYWDLLYPLCVNGQGRSGTVYRAVGSGNETNEFQTVSHCIIHRHSVNHFCSCIIKIGCVAALWPYGYIIT